MIIALLLDPFDIEATFMGTYHDETTLHLIFGPLNLSLNATGFSQNIRSMKFQGIF
jgi:hypothetical protein